jgi:hypothetical protein
MISPIVMMDLARERMKEAEVQADEVRRTRTTRRTRRFPAH